MKFTLFQKDGNTAGEERSSEGQTAASLLARMEAASQAVDVAVRKAEATARKAEAAAARVEVLVKQVEVMLEQVSQAVEKGKSHPVRTEAVLVDAKEILYGDALPAAERVISDSAIPLVAPFIMQEESSGR